MNIRRTIFGGIVLGGMLIILLALLGVFSPREGRKQPLGTPPTAVAGEGVKITADKIEVPGENWTLKASRFESVEGRGVVLQEPAFEMKRPAAGGEQRLTVTADEGTSTSEQYKHVKMTGHVRAEFKGEDDAVLTTEAVELEPGEGTGHTASEVQVVVDTREGRQTLTGRGGEFIQKQRTVTLLEDIRMDLVGGGGLFASPEIAPAKGASQPPAAPTRITCKGPAHADGFRRTVELKNEVLIRQGENELRADRAEVTFAEKGRAPQRLVAEGNIRFKTAEATGRGDRLVRLPLEDQLLLEGNPAAIQQGASEIRAPKVELNGRQTGLLVPVAGDLKFVPAKEDAASGPMTVRWARLLNFDPAAHRASFRGDVRLIRGDQTVDCQSLDVRFSPDNRQVLECRAEGRVNVQVRTEKGLVVAQAKEMNYVLDKDLITLSGNAVVQQEEQVIRGERIEVSQKEAITVAGAGTLESKPAAGQTREPITISWSGDMQFSRAAGAAAFRRDVLLTYSGQTLRADGLTAKLGADQTIEGFEAVGHAVVEQAAASAREPRTLKADKITAVLGAGSKLQRLVAAGHAAVDERTAQGARSLRGDRIVAFVEGAGAPNAFEATGHVVLLETGGKGRTLKAEKVTARAGTENKLESFEAVGRLVTLEEEGRLGKGTRLTWDMKQDLGVMTGRPVELQQGGNRLFGERIEFSQGRGLVKVTGERRVEAVLVPGKEAGRIALP